MSTTTSTNNCYFRRRTIGRAASPPTWACYEQIPYDDEYSDSGSGSDSCSEDDDDYPEVHQDANQGVTDSEDKYQSPTQNRISADDPAHDLDMDIEESDETKKAVDPLKDVKGKQKAVDQDVEKSPRQRRRRRPPVYTLRPILTIQKSQGFVWNQDLFVPPYIKDRYVASTSPPNSKGFISTSVSSTNSALSDYEVEVVEIRVKEGDLDSIMP